MAKRWTDEEVSLLTQHYSTKGVTYLCTVIPRSKDSIQAKAASLGLHSTRYTYLSNPELYSQELSSTTISNIETYKGARIKILHKCSNCSNTWKATPDSIRQGGGCPGCANKGKKRNTTEYVDSICSKNNLIRLSNYTLSQEPLTVKSSICGHTWISCLNNIQGGKGCPICNKGFGQYYRGESLPEKASIYLFEIHTIREKFFKVGITTRNPYFRQRELVYNIPDLMYINLVHLVEDSSINILEKERKVLSSFNKHITKYSFSGHTELLNIDTDISIVKEIMNENI